MRKKEGAPSGVGGGTPTLEQSFQTAFSVDAACVSLASSLRDVSRTRRLPPGLDDALRETVPFLFFTRL